MERPKLLFVDDDASIRQTLPRILTEEGFDVTTVATVAEAIAETRSVTHTVARWMVNISQPRTDRKKTHCRRAFEFVS